MLSLLLGKMLKHIIQIQQLFIFQKLDKTNQTKNGIKFYSSNQNFKCV